MQRLLPLALVLAVAVLVALLLWRGIEPGAAPSPGSTPEDVATNGDAGAVTPAEPSSGPAAVDGGSREDVTPQPVDPAPYLVEGLVLGDRRCPRLDDVRVVAYRGEPTDSSAVMMRGLNQRGQAPAFVLVGDPIASASVDNQGNFTLRAPIRHLRLTLEHELYTLPTPELVHVPTTGTASNVVLAPMLGACIRGRLFGERAGAITALRAMLEPDPMSMLRDMRSFLGAMVSMGRLRTEPDAELTFEFGGLIPGATVVLMAEGEQAFAFARQQPLVAGETREVALAVQNAASLRVAVVDEAGAGIAEAMVAVRAAEEGGTSMFPQLQSRRGHTAADGTCVIPSIEPTRVHVEAMASGYTAADATIDLDARSEPQNVELVLREGGVVTGRVLSPDGKPLAAAAVAHHPATEIPLLGDMAEQLGSAHLAQVAESGVRTDAEGRYRLSGLADDGEFLVVAGHPDYAATFTKGIRMGDTDVDITLAELGAIRGRVVADEDDAPIGSFGIKVLKTMFLVIRAPIHQVAITESDGSFALTGIAPGSYTLEVEAEGRSTESVDVRFEDGDVDVGTLRLVRGAMVSGIVQDEGGVPVRGALVRRRQGAMADNPMLAMFGGATINTRTDADGRFLLGPLPPKRLQLLASADGYASGRSERLELEVGATVEGVAITLGHGGTIEGVLLPGRGNHVHDFMLMAQHQQTQMSFGADIAEDGTFRIENLDPGPYVVQAMPNGIFGSIGTQSFRPGQGLDLGKLMQKISSSVVSQRCTVRAGESSEVKLDAEDLVVGTRWAITVEIGGQPLPSGILEATSSTGRLRATVFSNGKAIIGNIEPGTYEVRIRSGLTLAPVGSPQSIEFPAGKTEHTSQIELPGGQLLGTVLDAATGEPLRAALVRLVNEDAPERDDMFGMTLTDAAGGFTFSGLGDGTYGVVAAESLGQRDGAATQRGIRILAGTTSAPVVLRARPAATASVLVTTDGGSPILGATVLLVDAEGRPLGSLGLATTDASGRAWFGGMPSGAARVVGRAPGLAPGASEVREIDPSGPTEFVLTLTHGARTTVHAVDDHGRPLAGASLTARCNDGPWLPAMLLVERQAAGCYELGPLCPGTWDFRVNHGRAGTLLQRRVIANEPAVTVVVAPK
ncbi:MAG: carboxypeptidase regulatory-like domain-containing protein [Planctomycetes bacterium]|nr:carboxypeptidase regulatory-like domain-containing protein [Planctomycetota bacterium]